MSFGLKTKTEFLPFLKLNCKDGIVERSTFDGNERSTEVVDELVMLVDFETLMTGYMKFDGEAPDMRLAALGDPLPNRPGDDYKQGIKVVVMLPGDLGLHEIATTATAAITALEAIYDQVVAAPESDQGKVPAVKLVGWTREKTRYGPRAVPNFEIVGWKERPEAFLKHKAIPKGPAPMVAGKAADTGTTPSATSSKPIQSPSSKPSVVAQPKTDPDVFDPDDFG